LLDSKQVFENATLSHNAHRRSVLKSSRADTRGKPKCAYVTRHSLSETMGAPMVGGGGAAGLQTPQTTQNWNLKKKQIL
jgi:hypothetical protein